MKKTGGVIAGITAIAVIPAAVLVYWLVMGMTVIFGANAAGCFPNEQGTTQTAEVDVAGVPAGPIAGYKHEQLVNAAHIVIAAQKLGIDGRGQVIGVMTAMGESSLVNIGYGDWETSGVTNPDGSATSSIGLFQQQKWWGTNAERMNPETSATKFFTSLLKVSGWETLQPTIAAHRVQGNANPYHYAKFFDAASEIVSTLTGLPLTSGTDAGSCGVGSTGEYPAANGTEPGAWGGHQNGRIPENLLTPIPWQPEYKLRGDATQALIQLNAAFKAQFGYDLPINDGYRDYPGQVEAKKKYGKNAAEPGTSNHGWAMAIDVSDRGHWAIGFNSQIYDWLKRNGPSYGWVHPPWAEPGGQGPDEAWHWEYWGKASA